MIYNYMLYSFDHFLQNHSFFFSPCCHCTIRYRVWVFYTHVGLDFIIFCFSLITSAVVVISWKRVFLVYLSNATYSGKWNTCTWMRWSMNRVSALYRGCEAMTPIIEILNEYGSNRRWEKYQVHMNLCPL